MKRALSLVLTFVLLLTMAVPVFAVDATSSASTWTETPATTKPTTATTATPVTTAEGQVVYTVVKGDVMWKIAKDNGMTLKELIALNPQIKNADLIEVGQQIIVKAGAPAAVTPVATVQKYYLGAGMVPNYRVRSGNNDNLNLTTASVVFDANGKIVDLQWDVLEITPTMFQWVPAEADQATKDANGKAILEWETKREEGYAYDMTHLISKGAADNATKKEWFEQLDFFEEYFKGMTVAEVVAWFEKYTDANGRPYKMAYPEKLSETDLATVAKFTDAEKEMLVDVTTSATMSLQDSHSYFIDALIKAWEDKVLID